MAATQIRQWNRRRRPDTMAIFLTGSTGYIGAHVLSELLADPNVKVNLLVRAKTDREGTIDPFK